MVGLRELQEDYQKCHGVSVDLKSLADLSITHGKDLVRKKLNITKPNAKTTKVRS